MIIHPLVFRGLSVTDRILIVEKVFRTRGKIAAAQSIIDMGFGSVPALDEMLSKHSAIDLGKVN